MAPSQQQVESVQSQSQSAIIVDLVRLRIESSLDEKLSGLRVHIDKQHKMLCEELANTKAEYKQHVDQRAEEGRLENLQLSVAAVRKVEARCDPGELLAVEKRLAARRGASLAAASRYERPSAAVSRMLLAHNNGEVKSSLPAIVSCQFAAEDKGRKMHMHRCAKKRRPLMSKVQEDIIMDLPLDIILPASEPTKSTPSTESDDMDVVRINVLNRERLRKLRGYEDAV